MPEPNSGCRLGPGLSPAGITGRASALFGTDPVLIESAGDRVATTVTPFCGDAAWGRQPSCRDGRRA